MEAASPLAAGIGRLRAGDPAGALPLLEAAVREGEEPALARLNLAIALMDCGRLEDASKGFAELRAEGVDAPALHLRIGHLAVLREDWASAGAAFGEALRLSPSHPAALAGLALAERALGNGAAALRLAERAAAAAPDDPALRLQLGQLHLAEGEPGRAAEVADELLAARPDWVEAGPLRARALLEADAESALDILRSEATREPLSAGRAAALASALSDTGAAEEAAGLWRLAETLAPNDPAALSGLAHALVALDARDEAAACIERALRLRPADLALRTGLAEIRYRQFRLSEALAHFDQAIADFGPQPALLAGAALATVCQGRQAEAAALAREAAAGAAIRASVLCGASPYCAGAGTGASLHAEAEALRNALLPGSTDLDRRAEGAERRLRVGFLSSHFGMHPVGWLTLAAFEHLPRDGFEVVGVSLRTRDDWLGRRFRAAAERWVDLPAATPEPALVEALRGLGLDVLVELGGHGEGGRALALRHRCAPLQMKWVGNQSGPTGVPNIDFIVADRWEIPPELERFYTERPLRLADGYVCYTPPVPSPPVAPLPALRTGGRVTFGCFNNLAKITPETLGCWARVLAAVPAARLLLRTHALADPPTRAAFLERAAAAGVPLERLEARGPLTHDRLLEAYGEVDIALDPFPYTGGLTACEALWMGVPVVTLAGTSFAGRHCLSHLSNIGLPDWAASSPEEYVEIAARRASDIAGLAELRAGLRDRMRLSPLCDAPRFGRSFGDAIRGAWREACAAPRASVAAA